MSVEVEAVEQGATDSDLARCRVTVTDAVGDVREYDISLTADDTFDDGYLMAGRRVDGDHAARRSPVGPTKTAWDAAREHFEGRGFEVHY